ncbi:MAG: hypothetical protein E7Z89_08815 [Cyanobacteria bacterium SIG28]|nr:hypothetical protein [Cyanobacteria bacterium SIG28]
MGMSASQARLLALTSRIHDVEYKAQSIQAKKLQLANFSDAAYEKYLDALDATTLTIKRADNSVVPATFTNLCSSQGVKNSNYKGYSIRDEQGRLIVEQDVYDKLQNGGATDAYEFAALMLGVDPKKLDNELATQEKGAYNSYVNDNPESELKNGYDNLVSLLKQAGAADDIDVFNDAAVQDVLDETTATDLKEDIEAYLQEFKFDLYRAKGADIVSGAGAGTKEDYDASLFNYYANIYKQAQSDGYVSIETFNNEAQSGATNNNEWLNEQILSGRFTIESYSVNNDTGVLDSDSVMVGAQTDITYSNRTEIDKTELARAEAEYEKAMKDINAKEKRYDHELAKLDTERQALTTQIDSLKTQISDNIERTFGIFS